MLKDVLAGLMCLGIVTTGVALSRGQEAQEEPKSEAAAPAPGEEKPATAAATTGREARESVVEITIGGDTAVVATDELDDADDRIKVIDEDLDLIVAADEAGPERRPAVQKRMGVMRLRRGPAPAIDEETRKSIDQMIAGLKETAGRLASEGKKEEAEKKMQSSRALEELLRAGPGFPGMIYRPVDRMVMAAGGPGGPHPEELRKLHERLHDLHAKLEKLHEDEHEARETIRNEIAEVERLLGERHRKMMGMQTGMMPHPGPGFGFGGMAARPGAHFHADFDVPAREADALMHKSHALSQAARELKQAGLMDQSRELSQQAEKLAAESGRIREKLADEMRARAGAGFGPGFGPGPGPGGPPMELQRSIHELHEQIQQLRKEVAELRELLQRRQKVHPAAVPRPPVRLPGHSLSARFFRAACSFMIGTDDGHDKANRSCVLDRGLCRLDSPGVCNS